jgi:histidyl-tRNA synthetase
MGSQLGIAEKMKIPFVLIMGQKEAIDNTVMIRNLRSRSQLTIAVIDLPAHIKGTDWY